MNTYRNIGGHSFKPLSLLSPSISSLPFSLPPFLSPLHLWYMCVYMCVCVCVSVSVWCVCVCVGMYDYLYVYVCMYV